MADPAAPGLDHMHLQPCLAELLRTCVHPPAIVLRVEHVFPTADDDDRNRTHAIATRDQIQDQATSHDDHGCNPETQQSTPHCLRLALSDGELQIQAVLATNLPTKELLELRRGDLLDVKRFQVRKAQRVNGRGRVIYLGVDACEWAGNTVEVVDEDLGGGFIPEEDHEQVIEKWNLPSNGTFLSRASRRYSTERSELDGEEDTPPAKHPRDSMPAMGPLNMNRKRARESQDQASNLSKRRSSKPIATPRPTVRFATPSDALDKDSEDDDFETVIVSQSTIQQRREVLRNVGQNTPSRTVTPKTFQLFDGKGADEDVIDDVSASPDKKTAKTEGGYQGSRVGLASGNISSYHHHHHRREEAAKSSTSSISIANTRLAPEARLAQPNPNPNLHADPDPDPLTQAPTPLPSSTNNAPPPPLHTLSTLLHSHTLPRRNYTCSVLGVITWISPSLIHKANSPFPAKRHIKIHDASISSRRVGVTVAVYVDAREFMPEVGTVALFRGVTMQRWEGEVILNAYANLKDAQAGEEWFVGDEERLEELGLDVKGLRRWWVERKEGKTPGAVRG